jgi:hypothetical protein
MGKDPKWWFWPFVDPQLRVLTADGTDFSKYVLHSRRQYRISMFDDAFMCRSPATVSVSGYSVVAPTLPSQPSGSETMDEP